MLKQWITAESQMNNALETSVLVDEVDRETFA
jgi:hypothetical protein